MASVTLQDIRKRYGASAETIKGVDLHVRDGEFMVFVGPSGCGKSTLMRMIAGLENVSSGELQIGGKRANELPPPRRDVAMVFQNYALYPHMTVAQNMGFSLKMAKVPKARVAQQVARVASILKIEHLLERMPKALSGGQRQRVAIGRAIVRRPGVFLFDEPLSNLDAALRVQMRVELTKLHKELGSTMIYVTHDQTEAMTMGDRIVVFNAGHVEQVGTPAEIYGTPATTFVARFLGSPPMNILAGRVLGRGADIVLQVDHLGSLPVLVPETIDIAAATQFGVRPERWEFSPTQGWPVRVDLVERLGDQTLIYLQASGLDTLICAKVSAVDTMLKTGTNVCIAPAPGALHFFNAEGRRLGAV